MELRYHQQTHTTLVYVVNIGNHQLEQLLSTISKNSLFKFDIRHHCKQICNQCLLELKGQCYKNLYSCKAVFLEEYSDICLPSAAANAFWNCNFSSAPSASFLHLCSCFDMKIIHQL